MLSVFPGLLRRYRQPRLRRSTAVRPQPIATVTGPLDGLRGRRVLVLADLENLRYSARDLGYRLALGRLSRRLRRVCATCQIYAVYSRAPGDHCLAQQCRQAGVIPLTRDIITVRTKQGPRRLANADHLIAFFAGYFFGHPAVDTALVASGDGSLVCDLANGVRMNRPDMPFFTLSLAGSTSHRLDARRNRHINGNLEIGLDCLVPPGSTH